MASGETRLLAKLKRRPRLAVAIALGGAWVVFFARILFTTGVPYAGDLLTTTLPLRRYLRERVASGEWPQWYPYELLGAPFQGGILASPFHPQMWLLVPFNAAVATKWNLLLAFLAALVGAYRLARSLETTRAAAVIGAYAFAFGGYTVGLSNNLAYLVPLATAPWALHATIQLLRRAQPRHAAALGLAWALVLLGGDAQLLLELGALALVALVAHCSWRRSGLMALAGAVAFLLCAPELLPATVVGAESFRAEWRITEALGERWALHPLRLLELVIPGMTPPAWRSDVGRLLFTGKEGFWSNSFFAGGIALCLAALALAQRRAALVLAAVAIVFTWLAFGQYGGLLPLVWQVLPGLAKLRFPEKYVGVAWVLLAPLVAMGVDAARVAPRRAAIVFAAGAAALLSLAAWSDHGGLVTWAFTARRHLLPETDPLWDVLRTAWTRGLLTSGVVLVLAALVAWRVPRPGLIGLLLFAELGAAHLTLIPLASPAVVEASSPLATALAASVQPGEPSPRVAPLPESTHVPPDLPADDVVALQHSFLRPDDAGNAGVTSFDHNLSTETGRTMRLLYGRPALDAGVWLPRFNVCFRLLGPKDALGERDQLLLAEGNARLVRQPCLPRAFLASARSVDSAGDALTAVRAGLPEDSVVWERGPERQVAHDGVVRWLEAGPEHLRLEVTAAAPTALVVGDAYATGWSARVDGQPTTIYATNVAARGVAVEPGRHVVEFDYSTPLFRLGLVLFTFGVLLTIALAWPRPTPA
jgi:hypothetical protein